MNWFYLLVLGDDSITQAHADWHLYPPALSTVAPCFAGLCLSTVVTTEAKTPIPVGAPPWLLRAGTELLLCSQTGQTNCH